MHHIFYVQSGIAASIAKKSIEQLKLNEKKCLFLTGRKFKLQGDFLTQDADEWSFRPSIFFPLGWYKSWKIKKQIKVKLQSLNVEEFAIYTSSFGHWFYYVLSKDKRCKKIYALEEGRASYYTEAELRQYVKDFHYSTPKYTIYQIKSWFNHFFLHYPNPNKTLKYLKKCDGVIVTSKKCYAYVPNKIIIKDPFYNTSVNYNEVKCLMAFSYPVEDGLISLDNYIDALRETFQLLIQKDIIKIHYKFHPQQMVIEENLSSYQNVMNEFQGKIEFIELAPDCILEEIAANSDTIILSDYSSLMIYTETFGNKMLSNFSILEKYEPKISYRLSVLPQILLDLMEKNKLN